MYPIKVKQLLDVAVCIVIVLNKDGVVQLVNRRGCEVLGYEAGEIIGRNWFFYFLSEDLKEIKFKDFQQFLRDGCPKEFKQTWVCTKNKDLRLISWNNESLRDKEGNFIAMLSSGEDVTEKEDLRSMLALQEKEKRKLMVAAVIDAQKKERLHIASELHDNVGQILTTCKLLLEGETAKQASSEIIDHTLKHLQNAINEIRSISHQLNPAQLSEIGLTNALHELVKNVNLSSRIRICLMIEDKETFGQLDPTLSLSLFRIVQEQLNNILRHADASRVNINLVNSGKAIEMEITDNGKGFKSSSITKGLGLKNIHNRAELLNGKVVIQSAPGEGCTLSVYVPVSVA